MNKALYQKFNLSEQAIILPSDKIKCLYFELWGNQFLFEIFDDFLNSLPHSTIFIFSNGYRSDISERNFSKIKKDSIISIEDDEIKVSGIILFDTNMNWLIHRDPDFGTISFAYDEMISIEIINKLKKKKYYIDDKPRKEFYTDEID